MPHEDRDGLSCPPQPPMPGMVGTLTDTQLIPDVDKYLLDCMLTSPLRYLPLKKHSMYFHLYVQKLAQKGSHSRYSLFPRK